MRQTNSKIILMKNQFFGKFYWPEYLCSYLMYLLNGSTGAGSNWLHLLNGEWRYSSGRCVWLFIVSRYHLRARTVDMYTYIKSIYRKARPFRMKFAWRMPICVWEKWWILNFNFDERKCASRQGQSSSFYARERRTKCALTDVSIQIELPQFPSGKSRRNFISDTAWNQFRVKSKYD